MGGLDVFRLCYDIRYTFSRGRNASAITLKASGSMLSVIHLGSDDRVSKNSISITMLDSLKPFGCAGRNTAFAWTLKRGSKSQVSDGDQQEGERTVASNGKLKIGRRDGVYR